MNSRAFSVSSALIVIPGLLFSVVLPCRSQEPLSPRSSSSSAASAEGASAFAAASSMERLDDTRGLEVGDILAFRIVEDRSGLYSLIVTDAGDVEVPYIGRVKAEGKTPKRLAYEIKAELEKEHYQSATVIVALDWAGTRQQGFGKTAELPDRVNVWGAVNREGAVALPPEYEFKVADAILAAGGFTPFAKRKKVRIIRVMDPKAANPGAEPQESPFAKLERSGLLASSSRPSGPRTQEIVINLKDVMERGHIHKDIILKPNDVIIVDEKLFNF